MSFGGGEGNLFIYAGFTVRVERSSGFTSSMIRFTNSPKNMALSTDWRRGLNSDY